MTHATLAQVEFEQYLEAQIAAVAPECKNCINFIQSSVIRNAGTCNYWDEKRRACDRTCSAFSVKI